MMSVVKFYRGDPNAPRPTMGAHLGSNAIITCNGKILLEGYHRILTGVEDA